MPKKPVLRENVRLELYIPEEKTYYKSLIQGVSSTEISIGLPMAGGKKYPLKEGVSYRCCLIAEDALYFFEAKVLARVFNDVELFIMERPNDFERKQRRQFVRLSYSGDVDCWFWPWYDHKFNHLPRRPLSVEDYEHWMKENELGKPFSCRGIDLSGGGLKIMASRELVSGEVLLLALRLTLPVVKILLLKAEVIRSERIRKQGKNRYRCGLKFLDLPAGLREVIIGYIFLAMRRRLR